MHSSEGDQELLRRDLLWAMNSPSLLPYSSRLTIDDDHDIQRDLLDSTSAEQLTAVIPVGRYFESLVEVYLRVIRNVEILHRSQQVQQSGRTIGEVDFIFRDRDDKVCHLETAVKFYLHVEQPFNGSHFVGPNSADCFESKTERMLGHQLRLSETHFPEVHRRIAHMKGMIFYRPSTARPAGLPRLMNEGHLRGVWIHSKEFPHLDQWMRFDNTRFIIREKPHWLSDEHRPLSLPAGLLTADEVTHTMDAHFQISDRPRMLSVLAPSPNGFTERTRVMVVNDHWPG